MTLIMRKQKTKKFTIEDIIESKDKLKRLQNQDFREGYKLGLKEKEKQVEWLKKEINQDVVGLNSGEDSDILKSQIKTYSKYIIKLINKTFKEDKNEKEM